MRQERRAAGRDLQEEKTKRLLEERNREKEEEKAARERIKQQIAMVSSPSPLLSVSPKLTFIRKQVLLVPKVSVQLNVHLLLMAPALCSASCFNLFNNDVLKHNKPKKLGTLCFVSCRTGWRERHAMPKVRRRRRLPNRHYCRPGRQNRRTEGRQL